MGNCTSRETCSVCCIQTSSSVTTDAALGLSSNTAHLQNQLPNLSAALTAETMECRYGLLMRLNAKNVLTDDEVEEIEHETTSLKQNKKLIQLITPVLVDERKCEAFLMSLSETGQSHVATYISGCINPLNTDRPLTKCERDRLQTNQIFFIEEIDIEFTLFLDELTAAKCITDIHMSSIESKLGDFEKKKELFRVLKRRSFSQYQAFISCLQKINQTHVVHVLESDGVVMAVDVEQACRELESVIVDKFNELPTVEHKISALNRLTRNVPNVELISLRDRHSIRLYFLCHSLEAVLELHHLMRSDKLRSIIQDLFNSLLSGNQSSSIDLKDINPINYDECEKYFIVHREPATGNSNLHQQQNQPTQSTQLQHQESQHRHKQLAPALHQLQQQMGVELNLLNTLDTGDNDALSGVTELGDCIFVSHRWSDVLCVFRYNISGFERLDDITLKPTLKNAKHINTSDMTSCSIQRCLYIYDQNNEIIWRVKDEGRGQAEVWLSIDPGSYYGLLSVTSDGRMLLSRSKPCRLEIYEPEAASPLRTIELPNDIGNPTHAMETRSGDFVVLLEQRSSSENRVLLINKDGAVTTMTSLSLPRNKLVVYLAEDRDGHLFVATSGGNLFVYDSVLSEKVAVDLTVMVRGREAGPRRLRYCAHCSGEKAGRLIVGYNLGVVEVLNVISSR